MGIPGRFAISNKDHARAPPVGIMATAQMQGNRRTHVSASQGSTARTVIVKRPTRVSRILARMEDLALSKEQTRLNVFAILISLDGDAKTSCNRFVIPLPVIMKGSAFLGRRSATVQITGPESCVIPRKESWDYLVNLDIFRWQDCRGYLRYCRFLFKRDALIFA